MKLFICCCSFNFILAYLVTRCLAVCRLGLNPVTTSPSSSPFFSGQHVFLKNKKNQKNKKNPKTVWDVVTAEILFPFFSISLSGQTLLHLPQGTKLGPRLFILMINGLRVPSEHTWKYVDDTTVAEIVPRGATFRALLVFSRTGRASRTCNSTPINSRNLSSIFKKNKHAFSPM